MERINKEALDELSATSKEELKKVAGRWRKSRVTKLTRFSKDSHKKIKRLAKQRNTTMSKTIDFIIDKFFKHHRLYEND